MKKFPITLFLLLLAGSACQNVSPTPTPTSTPVPPPTPTIAIQSENLIEWADLSVGKGPVYSQAWSADGKWLATADYDQIRVWDAVTFREAGVLEGHTDFVWGLAWSPASNPLLLASASQDGSVRLWDAESHAQTAALETGWAMCIAWSPDGKQLAVGTYNGEVQVWDASARELLHAWKSETLASVISVAWSPDGKTIASGELGGEIYIWDVATNEVRQMLAGYTEARQAINGLVWSPDGSLLASAHQDGKVRMWARKLRVDPHNRSPYRLGARPGLFAERTPAGLHWRGQMYLHLGCDHRAGIRRTASRSPPRLERLLVARQQVRRLGRRRVRTAARWRDYHLESPMKGIACSQNTDSPLPW